MFVDIKDAIFMVAKNNKLDVIHFMWKKKIHSGTNPYPFCESDFCMNYMPMCAKSGLRNKLCRHFKQVVATNAPINTANTTPVVSTDAENFT